VLVAPCRYSVLQLDSYPWAEAVEELDAPNSGEVSFLPHLESQAVWAEFHGIVTQRVRGLRQPRAGFVLTSPLTGASASARETPREGGRSAADGAQSDHRDRDECRVFGCERPRRLRARVLCNVSFMLSLFSFFFLCFAPLSIRCACVEHVVRSLSTFPSEAEY
jgi:hypothetical protein